MVVAVVVSHWLLDVASHVPDMPVTLAGEARLGFGLWRSLPWTLAVELLLLASGSAIYLRSTRARDRIGSLGLGVMLVLLVTIYGAQSLRSAAALGAGRRLERAGALALRALRLVGRPPPRVEAPTSRPASAPVSALKRSRPSR